MSDISTFIPVGTIIPFAGEDPNALEHQGWICCDGRSLMKDNFAELFKSIGNLWGGTAAGTMFSLPDLRGQFLRTQTDDKSLDPDQDLRQPMGTGTPSEVGSSQTYGTAPPKTPFKASISNLKRDPVSYIDGCMDRPARTNKNTSNATVQSGGDKETRPKNKYVYFLIKSVSLVQGNPVDLPIGGIIPFAGTDTDGFDNNWLRCDGSNQPPRGVYSKLFAIIGYAHGKQPEGSAENFVLPNYQDYFLRGVNANASTDPDADRRLPPYKPESGEPNGNHGNKVGSLQEHATAIPVKADMKTSYDTPPTADAGKSTNGTSRTLYQKSGGLSIQDVTQQGGDPETRPANVRVSWYIRYL